MHDSVRLFSRRRFQWLALAALLATVGCAHNASNASYTSSSGSSPASSTSPDRPFLIGTAQRSGTTALLQAVSVVDSNIVWVGGHQGTYVRTTDGGATWHATVMRGADSLEFRDVYAVDARTAYLMSAGPGERSRIYKTTDGGQNWSLQFTNHDPKAFFDCMDFWDADHGIAVSDAVDGHFPIIVTENGGATWTPVPQSVLPAALAGEGGFAASGTCVVTRAPGDAWIGTGSASSARVLHTSDRGRSWTVDSTPVGAGATTGITSVAFRDARHGVALGGPIAQRTAWTNNVAITSDGGRTWTLGGRPSFAGAIYGGVYIPRSRVPTLVAVGPNGVTASVDDGRTWMPVDTLEYWSVGFASPSAGWAVGPKGRITKFRRF